MGNLRNWLSNVKEFLNEHTLIRCVVEALLTACLAAVIYYTVLLPKATGMIRIPERLCQAMFGMDVETFYHSARITGKYPHIGMDKRGNLTWTGTEEINQITLENAQSEIAAYKEAGVQISADYKTVTITDLDTPWIIGNANRLFGLRQCLQAQLFSGSNVNNVYVNFRVVDSKTNEVLYSAKWPNEQIIWYYNTDDGIRYYIIQTDGIMMMDIEPQK